MDELNFTSIMPFVGVMDGRGDSEKILAMVVLGFGSLLAGMLPAFISEGNRRRFPLATSLMLCFGAGILLATALVHILPEVRQQMPSNFAEISLCGGFFIIYFIDEFIHYFFGEAIQHTHNNPHALTSEDHHNLQRHQNYSSNNHSSRYGSLANETAPLLQSAISNTNNGESQHQIQNTARDSQNYHHSPGHCNDVEVASANARICHTSHEEPCAQTMTGTLGLFAALTLHSAIEGLAIGVQNTASKVLFLLGAVACHKFVMGFCLGLEFRSNPQTTLRSQFLGSLVFALGAVCGIGIGILIVDVPASLSTSILPVIQALAGGTLFYVTVCEVLPREKARWHQNTARKFAGFAQFVAVFIGFALMCVIDFYLDDNDT